MVTITAEQFAMNTERYLKEAFKHGIKVITSEGILSIPQGEKLTENGFTEAQESEILAIMDEARKQIARGEGTVLRSPEEIERYLQEALTSTPEDREL